MKSYLSILFVFIALWGCQKQERVPAGVAPSPEPMTTADAPSAPSPGNPHASEAPAPSSGAPVSFMQKLTEYKARLEKNPKDIEALVFLANANFDIQRFEKAKEFYLKALEIDPNNNHVRTDLASSYRSLGDSDLALNELNKVLKADPNHEVALYNTGIILLNDKNEPKKAAASWERLVQLKPDDPLSNELREKIKELRAGPPKPVAKEPSSKVQSGAAP
jgi:cytochrome c-type biogenesis protein CcmH/NrfG